MKRIWIVLGLLAALLLVLSGCGTEIKETGSVSISFRVPGGASEYPTIPPLSKTSAAKPRFIPAGTTRMDVAIYSEASNWWYVKEVSIVAGQSEYSVEITGIPVDTGYTIEVIPVGGSDWSLVMGRAEGIEISAAAPATTDIVLELFAGDVTTLQSSALLNATFDASGYMSTPVSIPYADITTVSAVLTLADQSHSFWITGSGYDSFDAMLDEDLTFQGVCADTPGTYHVYALEIEYSQPLTGRTYFLGCILPDALPVIEITSTGSAVIGIQ